MSVVKFDAHVHMGGVYYGRRAKTKIYFQEDDILEYLEKDSITHCTSLYIPEHRYITENVIKSTDKTILPFVWASKFDGSDEFDPDFDVGVKLHQVRNYCREKLDLMSDKVLKYLERLPDQTPIMIHTQDGWLNDNYSFHNIVKLASLFPRLKFIIAHMGSAGMKSRLPSNKVINTSFKNASQFMKYYVMDSCLVYGACMAAYLFDNVYIESSSLVPNLPLKAMILGQNPQFLEKIMIGSDKPFIGRKIGFREEENTFKRFFDYDDDQMTVLHQRALDWILKDKVGLENYEDRKFNMQWLNDTVRTPTKWNYIPRVRKEESE